MLSLWQLVPHALWIVGLAVILASWSYVRWWTHQQGLKGTQMLKLPMFIVPVSVGMALCSLGLALGSRRWWEIALWVAMVMLSVGQAIYGWHLRREQADPKDHQQLEGET